MIQKKFHKSGVNKCLAGSAAVSQKAVIDNRPIDPKGKHKIGNVKQHKYSKHSKHTEIPGIKTVEKNDYLTDSQVVKRANAAVKIELEKQKAMDNPVVVFDRKTQKIYHQNSDGTRTVVGERIRKGRYSERVAKES